MEGRGGERERLEREGEKEQTGEDKNILGDFLQIFDTMAARGMSRRLRTLA